MHTITAKIQTKVNQYPIDSGTKAGLLKIFQESGKLKSVAELRELSEKEQEWFKQGFEEYVEDHAHPVRTSHAHHHYGRWVYSLSLLYYVSLVVWLGALINTAIRDDAQLNWNAVWLWIIFASIFNIGLTFYGIHLELKSLKGVLRSTHRIMATLAIVVLVVAIAGNMLTPFSGSADMIAPFTVIK